MLLYCGSSSVYEIVFVCCLGTLGFLLNVFFLFPFQMFPFRFPFKFSLLILLSNVSFSFSFQMLFRFSFCWVLGLFRRKIFYILVYLPSVEPVFQRYINILGVSLCCLISISLSQGFCSFGLCTKSGIGLDHCINSFCSTMKCFFL